MNARIPFVRTALSVLVLCLSVAAPLRAADVVDTFLSSLRSHRSSFRYTVRMDRVETSGSVVFQDGMYRITGDGLELWCDGSVRYTLDRSAREVIVEAVGEGEDVLANPVLFLSGLDGAFARADAGVQLRDGKSCRSVRLSAVKKSSVRSALLFFLDGNPFSADIVLEDGHQLRLDLSSWRFEAKEKAETFRFDLYSLDKSFVITDLR